MKKLVIFDLDGTLLDTIEDLANATNYALTQYNLPTHPVESFRFFIGNGLNKLLERACPEDRRDAELLLLLRDEFIKYYFSNADANTKPYTGISELVNNLHQEGYSLAVASNKVHDATVDLVKRFFPDIQFMAVFGQREGFPIKPDPAVLEAIINISGFEKHEVVYIGDSGVDATTAIRSGVDFIGVLWGFRPENELRAAGATVVVDKPSKIMEYLLRKN
jgi:phosphoglycolate phosphatase